MQEATNQTGQTEASSEPLLIDQVTKEINTALNIPTSTRELLVKLMTMILK